MAGIKPLKLAVMWHMHQPNYQEPGSGQMTMPWVRLHATKDYLDMPLLAARFERVKVTFNLVPSLLDQIQLYNDGGTDLDLELSRIPAEQLNDKQRSRILNSFFSVHPTYMIEPYSRYNYLYNKVRQNPGDPITPSLFSAEEIRDLQTWWNLTWVDPMFRGEKEIKRLFAKGEHFTEEDKHELLDWQRELMSRIVPTYRNLFQSGQIDISFTPYYHPILPLLCNTEIAKEAIPSIELPRKPFRHPEDAQRQIEMSVQKFEELFGMPMKGMWPSEGSVSEEVALLCTELGIEWIATDEEILFHSLTKSGLDRGSQPLQALYQFGRKPGLKILFRDHALSDRIGFVYSGWESERAVADFVGSLKHIRNELSDCLDEAVVTVVLDGENAWEFFPDDGNQFLSELYRTLNDDPEIETISMTEAAQTLRSRPITRLFAGSWINHNFRVWIGHSEDNAAWDLLAIARSDLVKFEQDNQEFSSERIKAAWKQIYIAEGSDWCWWYGDEHSSADDELFDRVYRRHLVAMYECLGMDIPAELLRPIRQSASGHTASMPEALLEPTVDGLLTHFYEWTGAGYYNCRSTSGAMHRPNQLIKAIYFGFDHDRVYIRLDFTDIKILESLQELKFRISFDPLGSISLELPVPIEVRKDEDKRAYDYAFERILELAVDRSFLWPEKYGSIELVVAVFEGDKMLESWPVGELIGFDVPEKNKELFWPL